jgi:hypothetical protein
VNWSLEPGALRFMIAAEESQHGRDQTNRISVGINQEGRVVRRIKTLLSPKGEY